VRQVMASVGRQELSNCQKDFTDLHLLLILSHNLPFS